MPFRFPVPLFPIADAELAPRPAVEMAQAFIAAGTPLFELRAKRLSTGALVELARDVQAVAAGASGQLIINDRVDVAQLIGAAGVHLGQDDLPPATTRAQLGPEKLIGVSTHNLAQVDAAVRDGVADYLAFGPIFPTRSKAQPDPVQGLDGLRAARARCPLPLVAIGGIGPESVRDVLMAGADAVAVIGAVATADPEAATRRLLGEAVTALRARRRT